MNLGVAEENEYYSPHDALVGGVLCPKTNKPLIWNQKTENGDYIMYAESEGVLYILKESTNYRLEIISK